MSIWSAITTLFSAFNPVTFLINAALSWAIGEIVKDDLEQELDAKYSGTLVNKSSNIAQIPVIYGERKVGGTRAFVATSGTDNQYLYMVLALCEGEVDSIGDIYINDVISTDSKFSGLVSITKYTGTDTQTADSTLTGANIGWTSAHRLRGVVYLAIRLKWDNNVFGGIPTFHAVVKGRKVYNPATNTTAWSDNPALCLRDYLTNDRYGKGLSSVDIDDTLFNTAKTKCDEAVTPYANGTARALFSCNAVLDTSKTLMSNVKVLLSGMRGIMPYQQGKYGLIIEDEGTASFDFTEDHIIGGLTIQSEQKNSKFNRVVATFANPDANWQMDQIEYPEAGSTEESGYLSDDGVELIGRIDLPTITDIYTAEDIAEIALKRSRNALAVAFTATSEALECAVGDIVSVTHSTPAWDEKTFRVTQLSLNADGTVGVELVEHQDSIYPWSQKTEKDDIPDTNLPDPFIVTPATNLTVVPRALNGYDGTIVSVLDISWTPSVDSFVNQYQITITPSSGDAAHVITSNTKHRFQVLDLNVTYVVTVKPINAMGVFGSNISSSTITPVADTTAPSAPTNPNVTGTFKKIILDWDNPTDSDLSHIQIKRSNDSQEANASVIGTTRASQWIDEPYTGNTTRYFWIRAVDTSGNASAWVSMGSGTSIRLNVGDFDDALISPDFINQDFTNTLNAKATQTDLDTEVGRINTVVAEQQAVGNTFDTIAERMLTLATTQSDTLGTIANAGITVDSNTGAVSIQAVEALRSDTDTAINNVQVDLDAAEASINLKASTSYVNNAIASAVLDSADLASLNQLEATVDQVEIDLDAAEAAILLKADSTTVSGLDVRVGQAELDIDAAESAILLKASDTDLTAAENRITTAETTINALDIAAITNTVSDTRTLHNKLDTSAITNLAQLLDAYKSREIVTQEIAYARQEISADVRDSNVSIASAKLELAALIEDNAALITSEQTARADADSAIAIDIINLTATVGGNAGAITSEQIARAAADSAMASDITTLTATIDDEETGLSATASGLSSLTATVSDQGDTLSAHTSSINAINTTVGEHTTSITTASESIDGIKGQYTVTIDNNGHISGFGLVSDIIDGNPTSAFVVDADQFAIGSSGNYPFVYYANQTTVTKDGVDYDLEAGVYIQDAHIQIGAITEAHIVDGTITDAKIGNTIQSIDYSAGSAGWKIDKAGDIELNDAVFRGTLGAGVVKADNITIDDNITFNSDSSGLVFGKTSLGSTATGAFYGRAQNGDGEDIVGFHVSSPTSAMYADSDGNFSLSNVKMFAGSAGSSTYFTGAGDYVTNISSLSTSLAIELIGGGAGACNNPASDRPPDWRRNGAAGGDSWIEFYDEPDGDGDIVGTRITASGGVATSYEVGSNAENYDGASGKNSSQTNSGGSGGGKQYDTSPPTGSYIPADGIRGGGGGGAGTYGRIHALSAGVIVQAENGKTASSIITVPENAKSLKIHLGTGGTGGGKTGSLPSGFAAVNVGSVMTGWSYSSDGSTYYLTNGANGGDGFFEFSDPNTGGIEVDLVNLLNRVIALENA